MSETCTVEVGLLRKHPCGESAVAHCSNCEQPLCTKHAVAQLSASGARTGKFMCAQCNSAAKAIAKQEAAEAAHKMMAGKAPPRPAASAPPAAAEKKPEPPKEDSGSIDFTPSSKPADKK